MDVGSTMEMAIFAYVLMVVVAFAASLLIRGIVITLERMHGKPKAATAPLQVAVTAAPPPIDQTAHHVAAIAAAVYAVLGAHRLVYIGERKTGIPWTAAGRVIHQTSHLPKRSPKH
jgi:hypothetical protein